MALVSLGLDPGLYFIYNAVYNTKLLLNHCCHKVAMRINAAIAKQLETYTLKYPQEVLIVHTLDGTEADQIIIFKGFSSSLMHPTDFNPDNSVFSPNAELVSIDRIQSPYLPNNPNYIEQNISWSIMAQYLSVAGI